MTMWIYATVNHTCFSLSYTQGFEVSLNMHIRHRQNCYLANISVHCNEEIENTSVHVLCAVIKHARGDLSEHERSLEKHEVFFQKTTAPCDVISDQSLNHWEVLRVLLAVIKHAPQPISLRIICRLFYNIYLSMLFPVLYCYIKNRSTQFLQNMFIIFFVQFNFINSCTSVSS
jgi:hypothetical protein